MASAACCFSEEQFRNLCAELQQPGVGGAGWELLVKSMGVGIYWQLNQPTGHYKAFGVLDDFPPDLLADVYMDFNYRKEWDEFVKELYERECSGETVVHWEVESPPPKFNRDVSFPERHHYSAFEKIHVILAQSTSMPQFPEKLGMIQVRQFKQRLAIQSDGKRGSKGKKRARVGAPARATHVKARLTARHIKCRVLYSLRSGTGHRCKKTRETQFTPEAWLQCKVDV
uniref:Phosphatidylcholine transfer protein n=1 Tax=Balaenoptera musculus TaxID=9771 RepID=A0A8C0DWW5_BALMU